MTIIDFLVGRIGYEQAIARAAGANAWGRRDDGLLIDEATGAALAQFDARLNAREHAIDHNPARVLAECAAKLKIVFAYRAAATAADRSTDDAADARRDGLELAVRHLAAAWSDDPDYDRAWAPPA